MARLHPLVRDTSRPATGTGDRLAFLELAAELLEKAAAGDEIGLPEEPPTWPAWQLLTPHAVHVFDSVISEAGHPDEAADAAAYAAHMAARYQAEQGLHGFVEPQLARVLTTRLRVLGPDHRDTLATRYQIAVEMAARGDHDGAEAEFQDVLAAKLRVLGPDHPSTLTTSDWLAYLDRQNN